MNTIVDVLNELDDGTAVDLIAKIVGVTDTTFTIRYLSPTSKMFDEEHQIYKYEKEVYEIDKECVSGYYDSMEEEDAGFEKVTGGWIQADHNSDYQPSSSDESSDESLVDSEEED